MEDKKNGEDSSYSRGVFLKGASSSMFLVVMQVVMQVAAAFGKKRGRSRKRPGGCSKKKRRSCHAWYVRSPCLCSELLQQFFSCIAASWRRMGRERYYDRYAATVAECSLRFIMHTAVSFPIGWALAAW